MQFSKILVPTDFSESAKYALLFALDLAQKYRREAMEHPMVQKALDLFGGEVVEIKNEE